MSGVTAHMVVKNEDIWVWFAIQSILPYVDRFLVTDTGSTDHTVKLIDSIKNPKLELTEIGVTTPSELTSVRQSQLKNTQTDWLWLVDGDEIYPQATAQEIIQAVQANQFEGIVVKRFDLLGDIYHRQDQRVGEYRLFGHRGHLVTRLVNRRLISGLHYRGDYPLEGFYDQNGQHTNKRDPSAWYLTHNRLYHAMYLGRSTQGANLKQVLHRHKYKIETGISLTGPLPEVFSLSYPSYVPDPLVHRSLAYELLAKLITPVKKMKRKLFP